MLKKPCENADALKTYLSYFFGVCFKIGIAAEQCKWKQYFNSCMIICAFFYIAVTRQLFDNFSTTSAGATAVPSSPLKCCVGWNGVGRGALVSADWVPPLHNRTNKLHCLLLLWRRNWRFFRLFLLLDQIDHQLPLPRMSRCGWIILESWRSQWLLLSNLGDMCCHFIATIGHRL